MPTGFKYRYSSGSAVRVSSAGLASTDQTTMFADRSKRPEGVKIKRLQQQHSFPGQMTVSLDFDVLKAEPTAEEEIETMPHSPPRTVAAFNGGAASAPVLRPPSAPTHAWQAGSEQGHWPPQGFQEPALIPSAEAVAPAAPPPEPEVAQWAAKRAAPTITSSPAKHSVQIRIPNDRTVSEDPADENAFGGRPGADGGVTRSKLAMAEVRQRRQQVKKELLAKEASRSNLRNLEQGIRSRRSAAAAVAAASTALGSAGDDDAEEEEEEEEQNEPAPEKTRPKKKRLSKPSSAGVSKRQSAAAKRLSQPVKAPAAAPEQHPEKPSPPRAKKKSPTVDWDSLLVESDVESVVPKPPTVVLKKKLKSKQSKQSKQSGRRVSMDSAVSGSGRTRSDVLAHGGGSHGVGRQQQGAVGQLKSTWEQLCQEPNGKRGGGTTGGASLKAPRLGGGTPGSKKVSRTSSVQNNRRLRPAAAQSGGNARRLSSSGGGGGGSRRKSGIGGGLAVSASTPTSTKKRSSGSRNSLDSLLTDENTSGASHSSSPLRQQELLLAQIDPFTLSLVGGRNAAAVEENLSMLAQMNALLEDLMQQEESRARAEGKMLELREAAAHDRAQAEQNWISTHGDGMNGHEEHMDYIEMKLAAELAEIRKIMAYQRVESARHKLNLQVGTILLLLQHPFASSSSVQQHSKRRSSHRKLICKDVSERSLVIAAMGGGYRRAERRDRGVPYGFE